MRTQHVVMLVSVIAAAGIVAGCASSSRVPTAAARSQTEIQQERDRNDCDASTAAATTTRRAGDVRFAACMAARGYQVTLPVTVGLEHGRIALTSAAQSEARIMDDVGACERLAERGSSPGSVVAGSIGGVSGGNTTQTGPHGTATPALERAVAACLVERGYRATAQGDAGR